MAEATLVREGIDRVESAVRSVSGGLQRFQKDLTKRRRSFERVAQRRVDRFLADVRKTQVLKRAEDLRREAQKRLDTSVETMLGALQIASRSELERIDRRLTSINKKLREIEKATD